MMKPILPYTAVACLAVAMTVAANNARAAEPASRPNILFILADDIGYADVSCYGAKHAKTPAIDQLAKAGVKFSSAHSPASTCTPTRRAFLTGTYSWRQKPGSSIAPGDAALSIPPGTATVASLLKQAGYHTGVVGKWHLGLGPEGGPDWNGDIKPGPLDIGFDYAFIMPATGDRVPTVYVENRRVVGLDPNDPIKVSYREKVGTGKGPKLEFVIDPVDGTTAASKGRKDAISALACAPAGCFQVLPDDGYYFKVATDGVAVDVPGLPALSARLKGLAGMSTMSS